MSGIAARIASLINLLGGFCLGLVLAGVLSLAFLALRTDLLKPLAEKALAPQAGGAAIKSLKIGFDPLALTLEELRTTVPARGGFSLNLDHLEVRITPWKGLTKGAWLGTLTLTRPNLEYVISQDSTQPSVTRGVSKEAASGRLPDLTLLSLLPGMDELTLDKGRVVIRTDSGGLELKGISATLKPEETGPAELIVRTEARLWDETGHQVFNGLLAGRGQVFPSLDLILNLLLDKGRVDLESGRAEVAAEALLKLDQQRLTVNSLKAVFSGLTLRPVKDSGWEDLNLSLALKGWADLDGSGFEVNLTELESAGLVELSGQVSGSSKKGLKGRVEGVCGDPQRILSGLAPLLPKDLSRLESKGPLAFQARLEGDNIRAEVNPGGLKLGWAGPGFDLDLNLFPEKNMVGLSGPLQGPYVLSGFLAGEGKASGPDFQVKRFSAGLILSGTTDAPKGENLVLKIESGDWKYQGQTSPLGRIRLKGRASLNDRSDPALKIDQLDLEHLGRFQGQAALNKGRPALNLKNGKMDLAGLHEILVLAGIDLKGWTFSGTAGVEVDLDFSSPDPGLKLGVNLIEGGLSSADGDYLVDRLKGGLELTQPAGKSKEARLRLHLEQGEVLLKTIYLNLAQDPLRVFATGRLKAFSGNPVLDRIDLKGEAGRFGNFAFKGGIKKESAGWRYQGGFSLDRVDLARLFQTFVKEPLSITDPELSRLSLTGSAGLDLRLTGRNDQIAVKGRVRVDKADLYRAGEAGNAPVELVKGLSLDLPLSYRLGVRETAEPTPPKDKEWGRLKIKRVTLPFTEMTDLDLPLALKPNRLFLRRGLAMNFLGGKIEIKGISIDRPLSRAFRAEMSLNLSGLDLSLLGSKGMPLEGELHGRLEKVSLGLDHLRTRGRIRGTVFGGRVEVSDLRADRPFSSARTMGADVNYEKIHLERLSQALGIGRISGRISGRVDVLRMAYGQPVGFEMDLLSVKEKGVKQRVNLKAVNSISVLGTGAGLEGLGIKIMTKFFKDFPYKKIGIRCTLTNDVFKVRGLIREGGKEYLVKKPPLSGINVINSNPDNRISFSDMRARLKRVTGSEEGPTVQ